jgi:hypothetical protein
MARGVGGSTDVVKRTARPFAFIAHGDADREFASEIAVSLRESGLKSWVDARDSEPGVNWLRSAARALDRADFMILIFSAETSGAPELRKAFEFAITNRRFESRVVTIERRAPRELPFRFPWILRDLPFIKEAQDPRRAAKEAIKFLQIAAKSSATQNDAVSRKLLRALRPSVPSA